MSTPTFDEYCERHGIKSLEYGQAFAAYLHEITGGEWGGDAVFVSSGSASTSARSELHVEAADDDEAEDDE
ncbi:hypothetical protein ACWGR3_28875 [Streptomyces albidoflavus]